MQKRYLKLEEELINHRLLPHLKLDALNWTQKLCNYYAIPRRSTASKQAEEQNERKEREMQPLQKNGVCLSSGRFLGQHLPWLTDRSPAELQRIIKT